MNIDRKLIYNAFTYCWQRILQETDYHKSLYIISGWVVVLGHPFYYILWGYVYTQPFESLTFRIIGTLIGIPLILKNHWPKHWIKYQPAYWYIFIIYQIPFHFTFMVLQNDFVWIWALIGLIGFFFGVLIFEWFTLIISFTLGIILGAIFYILSAPAPHLPTLEGWMYLAIYLFAVYVGTALNYKKALLEQEKMRGIAATTGIIAHELRTPLLSIRGGVAALKKYLPSLVDTYEIAKEREFATEKIRGNHLKGLMPALERMNNEITYSNTIIDMLLTSARSGSENTSAEKNSIVESINIAMSRYPFSKPEDKQLVHWQADAQKDFIIKGNQTLFVHVIFNLLKNAIYFIRRAGKGDIEIVLEEHGKYNIVRFKDTGQGIDPGIYPHLFQRFQTSTEVGIGIGLYFCKIAMESFGGDITCNSKYGEYAEFVLEFPKVNN